ncbi:MAG: SDR family NAD(P)-dependent oxidoreductase [Streptosporangiaceae bacterium]
MGGRLQGKVAAITGGASGIGAATVRLFTSEGARVFSVDREQQPFAGTDGIVAIQADVSVEAEVRSAMLTLTERAGHVDILHCCAGIGLTGLLHETTLADWENVQAINLRGVYLTCKYVIPGMMSNGGGSIVTVSSGAGLKGSRSHHAYSAAKGGLVLLTRSIARSYGKYGIRANCICPGPIDTPMMASWIGLEERTDTMREIVASIPLGRLGRPEEVAQAALFLAADEASFVTGAVLAVDGGELS